MPGVMRRRWILIAEHTPHAKCRARPRSLRLRVASTDRLHLLAPRVRAVLFAPAFHLRGAERIPFAASLRAARLS